MIIPIDTKVKRLKQLFTYFIALPAMLAVILAWTATDESVAQLRLDYAALRAVSHLSSQLRSKVVKL